MLQSFLPIYRINFSLLHVGMKKHAESNASHAKERGEGRGDGKASPSSNSEQPGRPRISVKYTVFLSSGP